MTYRWLQQGDVDKLVYHYKHHDRIYGKTAFEAVSADLLSPDPRLRVCSARISPPDAELRVARQLSSYERSSPTSLFASRELRTARLSGFDIR
jgi:hypothetical protein